MSERVRLLFVCVENSNRSQMAEAFARIYGGDRVEAFSAGSKPSGVVNPRAIASMQELGYDLSVHASQSIDDFAEQSFDAVVTMGCGDACPWIAAKQNIDWAVPDPRDFAPERFAEVRDFVAARVRELLASFGIEDRSS